MKTFIIHTVGGVTINIYAEKFTPQENGMIFFYVGAQIVAVASMASISVAADSSMAKIGG